MRSGVVRSGQGAGRHARVAAVEPPAPVPWWGGVQLRGRDPDGPLGVRAAVPRARDGDPGTSLVPRQPTLVGFEGSVAERCVLHPEQVVHYPYAGPSSVSGIRSSSVGRSRAQASVSRCRLRWMSVISTHGCVCAARCLRRETGRIGAGSRRAPSDHLCIVGSAGKARGCAGLRSSGGWV